MPSVNHLANPVGTFLEPKIKILQATMKLVMVLNFVEFKPTLACILLTLSLY